MTFIDDDQIEEVPRIFFVKSGAAFILCQRLIDREINLAALDRMSVLNLRACVTELGKDFVFRIVNQNVAIREIKNFRATVLTSSIAACAPKFPSNLKCDRRFADAGRHRKKNAAVASDDRFDSAIDRDFLVVTFALLKREVDRR